MSRIGYNMTEGGGGMCGYKHTQEARDKISKRLTGVVFSESRNKKISAAHKGVPKTLEHRQALSEARKGKFTKEKNAFYGRHHSDRTKAIISKVNSGPRVCRLSDTYEILDIHLNLNDAGRWVVSQGLSAARFDTCAVRISEVCRNPNRNCTAYGFHWKYEEGPSTNCRSEDELHSEA